MPVESVDGADAQTISQAQRLDLKWLAELLINHTHQIGYPNQDVRGWQDEQTFKLTREAVIANLRDGEDIVCDCSEAVTLLFKWAGLPDPNGLDYSHAGYTGTLLAHLPHYRNASYANIGALVVFGPGTGQHVGMVIETGRDPVLFSHGERGFCGPILLSEEAKFHSPPVTFLSIAAL